MTSLDLAGLVLVAGRALDLDEAAVVAVADLEAATAVLAEAGDTAGGPERRAAILVQGLVSRQVFGPRSGEVALLAACQLLALHGLAAVDLGAPATEHILLGLVREGESGGAQMLAGRGADLETVRQEVVRQLTTGGGDRAAATTPSRERMVADLEALFDEIVRLSGEVSRLRELLHRHGIEPDEGTSRSA